MIACNGICVPDTKNILYIELSKNGQSVFVHLIDGTKLDIRFEYTGDASKAYRSFLDTIRTHELNMYPRGGGITSDTLQPLADAIEELKHIKLEQISTVHMQPAPTQAYYQPERPPRFSNNAADHWLPWDQITLDDVLVHKGVAYLSPRTFNCLRNYEQRVSSPNASILFKNINKKDLMRERNFGKVSWQEVLSMYEDIKKKGGIKV